MKCSLSYLVIAIVLASFLSAGTFAITYPPILAKVNVTDISGNVITNAIVTITIVSGGSGTYTIPYDSTSMLYISTQTFPDDATIRIEAVAPGYEIFSLNHIIDVESEEYVYAKFSLAQTGESWYVSDETLSLGSCDTTYEQKGVFTDLDGKVIAHCVKKSVLAQTNSFVTKSFIEAFSTPEVECSGLGRSGTRFNSIEGIYHLCVEKNIVNPGDQIVKDAIILTNSGTCSLGFESTASLNFGGSTGLHCVSYENKDTSTSTNCVVNTVWWGDEVRAGATEYTIGQEKPLILFADTNSDCENENFVFTVFYPDGLEETFIPNKNKENGKTIWWYTWDLGPAWPEFAPGAPISSISIHFAGGVPEINVQKNSSDLIVYPEQAPCEDNSDCLDGKVCRDGDCIIPEGDCLLTNPRWLKDDGTIITSGEAVGWEEGKANGTDVYLSIDVNDNCAGQKIGFKIFEDEWGKDDEMTSTPLEGNYDENGHIIAYWPPPWFDDLGIRWVPWVNRNPEYYFYALVEGSEVQSTNSSLLEVTPPGDLVIEEQGVAVEEQGVSSCQLENPRWYDSNGAEITGPVNGWKAETDLNDERLIVSLTVSLVVDKVESVEGGCSDVTTTFEVYELDGGGGYIPPRRKKETRNLPGVVTSEDFTEDDIAEIERVIGKSLDEAAVALWVPRMFNEPTDTTSPNNPRYQFKAKTSDGAETGYSETLTVGVVAKSTGLSGSGDSGSGGGNFLEHIWNFLQKILGIFGI